jgi:hypothetical protein
MSITINTTDLLADQIIQAIGEPIEYFEPFAFYNTDGDCIEFFIAGEKYYGERVDEFLTVYRDADTDAIVGSVIKNVKQLCRELSEKQPGFAIIIQNEKVRIQHLFIARILSQLRPANVYKELAELAEKNQIDPVPLVSV